MKIITSRFDRRDYQFARQTPYHERNIPFADNDSKFHIKFEHKLLIVGAFFFTFWAFLAAQVFFGGQ